MKAQDHYRQGDLLFLVVGSAVHRECKSAKGAPRGTRNKRPNGHILEGEVTGHIHRIGDLDAAEVFECGEGLYLNVTEEGGVSIVHEDHGDIKLPMEHYEVVRQREYSPDAIRNVAD